MSFDALYDLYVTCPDCGNVFRVEEGKPRTSEEYRPSFMEAQAELLSELEVNWKKKVQNARTHQRAIGVASALEHLTPLLPNYPGDLRDARFIGGFAPCDIMSLDGYAEGKMESLTFIEIKTGKTSRLTTTEKNFKEVIDEGHIAYDQMHIPFDDFIEFMKDAPIKHKKGGHEKA